MTLDEQIAILNAIKEGKKIEAKRIHGLAGEAWSGWEGNVDFAHYDYRIVPEPRRFVIYRSSSGILFAVPYEYFAENIATIICTATEDANLGEAAAPYLEALKEKISRP